MHLNYQLTTSILNKNLTLMVRLRSLPTSLSHRHLSSHSVPSPPAVTLYQYEICPFCNINKALLNYTNTPYKYVEVNPLTKSELKPWSGDYKKVPIAKLATTTTDEENDFKQINGSSEINTTLLKQPYVMQKLKSKWDSSAMSMDLFTSSNDALKWSKFANEELAPILYPNICRSMNESYQAFGYVNNVDTFSMSQRIMIRWIGSFAMYIAASKIKSKRNIQDERQALEDAIVTWEKEGLDNGNKSYSSGLEQPNLGDISMFGVMHSVSGLSAHDEVILGRDGIASDWYRRMEAEVIGTSTK